MSIPRTQYGRAGLTPAAPPGAVRPVVRPPIPPAPVRPAPVPPAAAVPVPAVVAEVPSVPAVVHPEVAPVAVVPAEVAPAPEVAAAAPAPEVAPAEVAPVEVAPAPAEVPPAPAPVAPAAEIPAAAVSAPAPVADVPSPLAGVSRQTLEETPARVLSFLRAVGTTPAIRALMASRGYEASDHQEGWDLLHSVSGYTPETPPQGVDVKVRDAIVTLDNEDEDLFRILGPALRRLHPLQAKYVLDGLGPAVGPAAVSSVKLLLKRLDSLETSPERIATRPQDHAALATLAKRGIDAKERARLSALVEIAESGEHDEPHLAGLGQLYAWYEDWSAVARSVVKRSDYQCRMGVAKGTKIEAAAEPPVAKVG